MQTSGKSWLPFFAIILFVILASLAIVRLVYYRVDSDELIAQKVVQLAEILERIEDQCNIIDFDRQKTPIDFLNVVKFVGSEVGGMNLAYPENWTGPYLNDNPTIQDKEFQVVRTKQGYFVTPGDGVVLSNGKVVGKDIVLDENADILKLMADPKGLNFNGKPLAAQARIRQGVLNELMYGNIMGAYEE
jgi:hypothetical protein